MFSIRFYFLTVYCYLLTRALHIAPSLGYLSHFCTISLVYYFAALIVSYQFIFLLPSPPLHRHPTQRFIKSSPRRWTGLPFRVLLLRLPFAPRNLQGPHNNLYSFVDIFCRVGAIFIVVIGWYRHFASTLFLQVNLWRVVFLTVVKGVLHP